MTYCQLTSAERYMLAALRKQGLNQSQIARALDRHRCTISRELCRNSSRSDGHYRPSKAQERTDGRGRSRSRRNLRFTAQDSARVDELLYRQWSPEQVAGHLSRLGQLGSSFTTPSRRSSTPASASDTASRLLWNATMNLSQYCSSNLMSGRSYLSKSNRAPHVKYCCISETIW
jgi:hypothetical protein